MKKTLTVKIEVETPEGWPPSDKDGYIARLLRHQLEDVTWAVQRGITSGSDQKTIAGIKQQYQYTITEE